jgi:hypothetical protein
MRSDTLYAGGGFLLTYTPDGLGASLTASIASIPSTCRCSFDPAPAQTTPDGDAPALVNGRRCNYFAFIPRRSSRHNLRGINSLKIDWNDSKL